LKKWLNSIQVKQQELHLHKFVIMVNGELKTYTNYDDIPETFDHVIEFIPDVPEPPHTEEQHDDIDKWTFRLHELMEREKYASSNKNR
jgi:hypothetical protein